MKKIFTLTAACVLLASQGHSQAARFALFEHFTQASCGPCAAQNPGFESTILTPNPQKVRHIAYHTSWPGVDPMNAHNPTEVASRVSYYSVSGVPDVFMNGNQKNAQPGGFNQDDVDGQFSMGSPIKIEVTEVDMGSTRDVTVKVLTVGTVPAGTYKIYTAVIEAPINYASAPGSNGETHFPNVFRKMLPSISGDSYVPAAVGSSVTFNYTYTEHAAWNTANLKVVAFVQRTSDKEILNSGTTFDPVINYTLGTTGNAGQAGTTAVASTFNLTSMNTGTASEDFIYTLTTDAPTDWTGSFTVNASPFTTTGTVTTAAGAVNNIEINVTPGATPAVATYTLSVASASTPSSPSLVKKVYVIANVTDLVVNNTGGPGASTTGLASSWASVYTAGLDAAGNSSYATTTDIIARELGIASALTNVNNIYYNVGWTFPSIEANEIPYLEDFMDAGGNLFLAGQDIGWEINDAASPYTYTAGVNFYHNYLHAGFSNDGGTSNTQLTTVTTDLVYGGVPNSTINPFYGASYLYPDELTTAFGGTSIFKYNATAKVAGLRYQGTYKLVYLGVGPEMLSASNANTVIKTAHDWFYGTITGIELDEQMQAAFTVYPNPAASVVNIQLPSNADAYKITDLSGRVLISNDVVAGSLVSVDLGNVQSGSYQVSSYQNGVVIANKPLIIQK